MRFTKPKEEEPHSSPRSPEERIRALESQLADRVLQENLVQGRLEALYELTEHLQEVFWLTDWENNEVLYISPSYEVVYGHPADRLYDDAASWLDPIHPDDRRQVYECFQKEAVAGGYDMEYRVILPDGSQRWIHDRAVPIKDETGRVVRLAGVSEDITRRKTAEQDLHRFQEHLQELVDQRTRELRQANEELLETQERQEKLIADLQQALAKVRTLRGLLPMCAHCKKIRDDHGYWCEVEDYFQEHTESNLNICICPDCIEKITPNSLQE